MPKFAHKLSDPRDPGYPFSNTFVCSNCNERIYINDLTCQTCDCEFIVYDKSSIKDSHVDESKDNQKAVKPIPARIKKKSTAPRFKLIIILLTIIVLP